MLSEISHHIREHLTSFSPEDKIIFNSSLLSVDAARFSPLVPQPSSKPTIAFIDGGQAEIISAGNFCLSFIRVGAIFFQGEVKMGYEKKEFYLFTRARYADQELFYESQIFSVGEGMPLDVQDLTISSTDSSIRVGLERAPITAVSRTARRFAELQLAAAVNADHVLLDGTLEPTLKNEEKYIARLPPSVSALAKTCSLFTTSGNNPAVMLNKIAGRTLSFCTEGETTPSCVGRGCWRYHVENKTFFVKLHEKAKHVFRFEGDAEVLPYVLPNSRDALFLGYPYGLILADQLARVSKEEKNSLRMNFLLRKENKEILDYLNTSNAHEILDGVG